MAKHILKGKFYIHSDKNKGHPTWIYYSNYKKNIYKGIKFTSKKGSDRTLLKHNIDITKPDDSDDKSYAENKPVVSKRKYIGSKELTNFRINKEDKPIINKIKRKK